MHRCPAQAAQCHVRYNALLAGNLARPSARLGRPAAVHDRRSNVEEFGLALEELGPSERDRAGEIEEDDGSVLLGVKAGEERRNASAWWALVAVAATWQRREPGSGSVGKRRELYAKNKNAEEFRRKFRVT